MKCTLAKRRQKLSQEAIYDVLKSPLVTEKATLQRNHQQYAFLVASWANKFFVKQAIEKLFSVRVKSVNTICVKGKTKRFKGRLGVRSDYKKAIVRLENDQHLDLNLGKLS